MFTHLPRQGTHPRTAARNAAARLSRLAAAVVAVTCGLLASAATIPAAFARVQPDPGAGYVAPASVPPQVQVRTIVAGGMPGWQITLIALGAALVAAAATLLLDRALAAHRVASATSA
jgi:hypothetical protein